ncbi:MAG: DUF402 domain-containing protein [Chloroflexi bacterium]|nr:DUF402 domain-containing protein [Chloroflexota bacterium]
MTEADPPPTVIEVKRHLDGREERFETELVYQARGAVIVRYARPESPWGLVDWYGWYWSERSYVCYHMVRADDAPGAGREVVTRFDVARDIEITDGEVHFRDLLLDLVVEDGVPHWEDEDEVAEARDSGLLSAADAAYVVRARRTLEQGHRRIVRDIRWLLTRLGRLPG